MTRTSKTRPGAGIAAGIATALALLGAGGADAQYFGENQVRYRRFDFKLLKTEHFDIYFYPEEEVAVQEAARMAERWYARLSRLLDHQMPERQPLILYASHPHFEQTNVLGGPIGEGTGGVTEFLKRRIVLPLAGPLAETDHVLGHELVHAFQFDISSRGRSGGMPGIASLPLWFVEGMAEYLSIGPRDAHTAMWMRDAVRREKFPSVSDLNNPRYFPYRYGQALWAYVASRWGDEAVGKALKLAARGGDAIQALEKVLEVDRKTLSKDWHDSLKAAYGPLMDAKPDTARQGRVLVTKENGGELNVGPALSPDGRRLVFLSSKNLFSIEMFLADAETGKVIRRLVKTAADPHFDSLQFIASAGAWSPDGREFVFAAVSKGQPVLTFIDGESGRKRREVVLEQVDEAFTPSFSPDGKQVVFSGNSGGLLDLFVFDLRSSELRRLTRDAFAELQPAWSPDGSAIAVVTDRFSTRLGELAYGEYELALVDAGSGEAKRLHGFDDAKCINPQWSADGRTLFFLSDRNGITNVYRLERGGGAVTQLTDLPTGVSGITALSPALAVGGGRAVASVYQDGEYVLYAVEGSERLAGRPLAEEGRVPALLAPPRPSSEVVRLVGSPEIGLPKRRDLPENPYRPKLSLDMVSQTQITLGSDSLGSYVGGGVGLSFSDMLGDHNVGAVIQASGRVSDIGGVLGYENRKRRWNWGASLERIPLTTGSFANGNAIIEGQPAYFEQSFIVRETHTAAESYVAYPFSRAHRLELGAGFRNIGFDRELETVAVSLDTGQLLLDERTSLEAPASLSMGEARAALVYDTAVYGPTSPILGRRYRFEVSQLVGSLDFTGVLVDFRQYLMPIRPWTLAFRALHYGRYGSGGEDPRLTPLFIGYPGLLRGYDYYSFEASECVSQEAVSCPAFAQLEGSRMALVNLELRVPPFGALGARNLYGPIPIELLAFADAGVAWTSENEPSIFGGNRDAVRSVGFGARVNLFGYLVGEVDYVKPLDRNRGWLWQFNLTGGF